MSELVSSAKKQIPRVPFWVRVGAVGGLSVAMLTACGDGGEKTMSKATASASASGEAAPSASDSSATDSQTSGENSAPAATETQKSGNNVQCGAGTVAVNGVCEIAPTAHTSTPAAPQTHIPATRASSHATEFAFDSHGSDISKGGSNVIYVYSDPSESGRGTESGTFMSGQETPIDCYIEGRTVSRHPEQGETAGSSSTWYHLANANEYATGAYGAPTASVPHC